jgi:TRAP-type C4-dicarboxylate transport system permease small subunit
MNKLLTALSILVFLGCVAGGYLLEKHISSILDFGEGLFVWLTILCASIWFGRRNKDGLYMLFKDIHQSNLDDIERQELEK